MSKTESVQSHKERRAQWRALVNQARESGQSPGQFCQEHGPALAKFYYWRRVLVLESPERATETHFALVRRGVDEQTLRVVLGALSKYADHCPLHRQDWTSRG